MSLSNQELVHHWQANGSSETFRKFLRAEFHSLRVINAVSECALVFGQAEHDRVEATVLERPLPPVCLLRLPSSLGLIPISQSVRRRVVGMEGERLANLSARSVLGG